MAFLRHRDYVECRHGLHYPGAPVPSSVEPKDGNSAENICYGNLIAWVLVSKTNQRLSEDIFLLNAA